MTQIADTNSRTLCKLHLSDIGLAACKYSEPIALGDDGFLSGEQCYIVVVNVEFVFCSICISKCIISAERFLTISFTTFVSITHRSFQVFFWKALI